MILLFTSRTPVSGFETVAPMTMDLTVVDDHLGHLSCALVTVTRQNLMMMDDVHPGPTTVPMVVESPHLLPRRENLCLNRHHRRRRPLIRPIRLPRRRRLRLLHQALRAHLPLLRRRHHLPQARRRQAHHPRDLRLPRQAVEMLIIPAFRDTHKPTAQQFTSSSTYLISQGSSTNAITNNSIDGTFSRRALFGTSDAPNIDCHRRSDTNNIPRDECCTTTDRTKLSSGRPDVVSGGSSRDKRSTSARSDSKLK
ncbi:hypothetical protein CGCTS75_v010707 [Colletotrichum tropicale]|nr:hypothetical protein CGCTS75_v010707 [Colletotrichum tropicale]